VITGTPESVALAKNIISALDTLAPSVNITFRLIDITPNNDQKKIGFLFGGFDSSGNATNNSFFAATKTVGPSFFAQLNALDSEGRARIIERPSFSVLSGEEGQFDVANDYNFFTQTGGISTTTSIQKISSPIKVTATPIVDPTDKSITLTLDASFSQVISFGAGNVPNIGTRHVKTTFRLQPGQTALLGGLLSEDRTRTETKIPLLGDIPLLGRVFREAETTTNVNEIAIAITADLDNPPVTTPIVPGDPTYHDPTLVPQPKPSPTPARPVKALFSRTPR
jgi:type II secretory pathway component GspD/PulD (secretin)